MNPIRNLILFGNLLVFLFMVNWGIWTAEQNIAAGTLAYLELAPVDPRSLFQGDYMRLAYAIEDHAQMSRSGEFEHKGFLVIQLDEQQVARFVRIYEGEDLEEGELLIKYASPYGWSIEIGIDSYFFQEGNADIFANAKYAEVRILEDGNVMLIALRDANLVLLEAPKQDE
jgi:uncharacterized membrane-anchored protein